MKESQPERQEVRKRGVVVAQRDWLWLDGAESTAMRGWTQLQTNHGDDELRACG
jgi:hypothetical protein